jgi:arylsulfatase A-like enzyme
MIWLPLVLTWACTSEPSPTRSAVTPSTAVTIGEDSPTNLVIISLDTVSASHMKLYGGPAVTPNISAVARNGALFTNAISPFPETAVAHWSLMTGVLPTVHGDVPAFGNSRYTGPTLAEHLQSSGFSTAAFIGGETLTDRSTGLSRGFSLYDDQHRWDRSDLKRPGAEITQAAVSWVRAEKAKTGPFFAFVHYFDAHFPYTPAPPWDTAYLGSNPSSLSGSDQALRPYRDGLKTPSPEDIAKIRGLYQGEISELDALLAPLLAEIDAQNTTVVITADHGESFGHDYWFNHRDGLWDEVIRVPLIMRGPTIPKGVVVTAGTSLVNVVPTVLEALNLPPINGIHGQSMGEAMSGKAQDKFTFSITDPTRPQPQFAARLGNHKLISPMEDGRLSTTGRSQYDLSVDRNEREPTAQLPSVFDTVEAQYQSILQPVVARSQGPKPQRRTPDHDEHERLRALGYEDGPARAPAPK